MPLASGTRFGPYEVLGSLGTGRMGEVYRARDTKLGRDVALKILSEPFSRDADRIARFGREAQLLASLSHPNIAIIHGVEEADGVCALVLELIEGETLGMRTWWRWRLAQRHVRHDRSRLLALSPSALAPSARRCQRKDQSELTIA